MKLIPPRLHAILDYLTVVFLGIAPVVFNYDETLRILCYVLAGFQLALSTITKYEFGLLKIIPFLVHGWIEVCIGGLLAVAACFFWHAMNIQGFYLCGGLSLIYLVVPLLTRFQREHNIAVIL